MQTAYRGVWHIEAQRGALVYLKFNAFGCLAKRVVQVPCAKAAKDLVLGWK